MKTNFKNLLMLAAAALLAGSFAACGSDDEGGGSNGGGNGGGGTNIPINAPKAESIGWPQSSQPVIDGMNGLIDAINPDITEPQREALDELSEALENASMDPKSYMPIVALATVAEDPARYGSDYFAAVKTNLSAYSGTLQLDPTTGQWVYNPTGDGKSLDIKFTDSQGRENKVTIDRSGSTGVLHTKTYDITQEYIDRFVAEGNDVSRLGLSAEQLAQLQSGKAIRMSLEMPTHATTHFYVDGAEIMNTTMDIAELALNDSGSGSKQRRAVSYYAMIDRMDVTGSIGFGPYSIVLSRFRINNGKLDLEMRMNQGNNLILGIGIENQWAARHFTSYADFVPTSASTWFNMLNVTTLRVAMVDSKREDIVKLVKMMENSDDTGDELKVTGDMAAMMLNTYFDIAFYTPNMGTRLGTVFFKNEMVMDEDGDVDEELVPYVRTTDGQEHALAEAVAAKWVTGEVQSKVQAIVGSLLRNSMLTHLFNDPFFGVSVSSVSFIPGEPVHWTFD